jgi:glycosyltransferase involved in cell wall biosynthesis
MNESKNQPVILIISHDTIGTRMAGTGIRYWEMAHALAAQQPVTLVAPRPIDIPMPEVQTDTASVTCGTYTWGNAKSLAGWIRQADVVVANGVVLQGHSELAHIEQPLAIDLYDPTLLENLELFRNAPDEQRVQRTQQDVDLLRQQLAAGDFFLCASERQRDLYLGSLMASGRVVPARVDADPHLRDFIDVVGFGLPSTPPTKQQPALRSIIDGIGNDDPLILWTGGLWDWMDPLTLVEAMPAVVAQCPDVRLVFLAGQHPGNTHPMRMPGETKARAEELNLLNRHVFLYEQWVPYQQRADVLLEATIAVSLHRDHLETRYAAVRSRILDHLWAGLPGVVSAGDPAATLLADANAALVVEPGQSAPLADAIIRLLTDTALRTAQAENAAQLALTLTWERVIAPLAHFCMHPHRTRLAAHQPEVSDVSGVPEDVSASEATVAVASLQNQKRILTDCRNAAVMVQEETWRLHEPSLASGRFARLRRFLVNQIVRPFVLPIVEQQQAYNTAVLRSMYAMNELSDDRYQQQGQVMSNLQQQTHQQLGDITEQLAGLEDADNQIIALLHETASGANGMGNEPTNQQTQPQEDDTRV